MNGVELERRRPGAGTAPASPGGGNVLGNARKVLGRIRRMKLTPKGSFWSPQYIRHNQRRQEHLASLGLEIAGRDVLEVGAGIGDHTSFFLDRGCRVTITDGRPKNVRLLRERYPDAT